MACGLGLSNCDQQAELLWGMWDLLGSGIELESPALVDGFFTTELPGKPPHDLILFFMLLYALWELATFNLLPISFIMLSKHGVKSSLLSTSITLMARSHGTDQSTRGHKTGGKI